MTPAPIALQEWPARMSVPPGPPDSAAINGLALPHSGDVGAGGYSGLSLLPHRAAMTEPDKRGG